MGLILLTFNHSCSATAVHSLLLPPFLLYTPRKNPFSFSLLVSKEKETSTDRAEERLNLRFVEENKKTGVSRRRSTQVQTPSPKGRSAPLFRLLQHLPPSFFFKIATNASRPSFFPSSLARPLPVALLHASAPQVHTLAGARTFVLARSSKRSVSLLVQPGTSSCHTHTQRHPIPVSQI